jgi:hypothetical protein
MLIHDDLSHMMLAQKYDIDTFKNLFTSLHKKGTGDSKSNNWDS